MNIFVKIIVLLGLILCQCACSTTSTQEAKRLERQSHPYFASIDDAAIYVSSDVNPESIREDREFIGLILHDPLAKDSRRPYTYTVAKGAARVGQVSAYFMKPRHMRVVALWHTHGGKQFTRKYFSSVDTRTANTMGVPFYMADYTGTLRIYTPGDSLLAVFQARKLGLGARSGYAEGRVVRSAKTGQPVAIATRMSDSVSL